MTYKQKILKELEDGLARCFGHALGYLISRDAAGDVDAVINACMDAVPLLLEYKNKREGG